MAVPTITAVSPSVIYTGGQMIAVTGTNFRTAYPPPDVDGPLPVPPPTVQVLIGTSAARKVVVSSTTTLTCITPPVEPGAVTVTVKNLDAAGNPIAGETVSATNL